MAYLPTSHCALHVLSSPPPRPPILRKSFAGVERSKATAMLPTRRERPIKDPAKSRMHYQRKSNTVRPVSVLRCCRNGERVRRKLARARKYERVMMIRMTRGQRGRTSSIIVGPQRSAAATRTVPRHPAPDTPYCAVTAAAIAASSVPQASTPPGTRTAHRHRLVTAVAL
jgi:hypothetical protein